MPNLSKSVTDNRKDLLLHSNRNSAQGKVILLYRSIWSYSIRKERNISYNGHKLPEDTQQPPGCYYINMRVDRENSKSVSNFLLLCFHLLLVVDNGLARLSGIKAYHFANYYLPKLGNFLLIHSLISIKRVYHIFTSYLIVIWGKTFLEGFTLSGRSSCFQEGGGYQMHKSMNALCCTLENWPKPAPTIFLKPPHQTHSWQVYELTSTASNVEMSYA